MSCYRLWSVLADAVWLLNKVAQGTQLDCTSLELPKVRAQGTQRVCTSLEFKNLRLDIEYRPDDWISTLRDLCRLYLADPVTLRGDTWVVLVCFVSLWAFYKCIQSKSAINTQYTSMESISTPRYFYSTFTHWSSIILNAELMIEPAL